MYEEFNGKLPASRMRACGKGSDRKANATARLLRGNEKSLCWAATDFNRVPSHDQHSDCSALRKKYLPFPEYARFRFLHDDIFKDP